MDVRTNKLGSSFDGKDLEVLVYSKLSMSQLHGLTAMKVSSILDITNTSTDQEK